MTRRITRKNLDRQVTELNHLATYLQLGCYFELDGAYGGWRLERYLLDGSCLGDELSTGYVSKPKLYDAIYAFMRGLKLSGTATPTENRLGEYKAS